jgi:hypothetical protein
MFHHCSSYSELVSENDIIFLTNPVASDIMSVQQTQDVAMEFKKNTALSSCKDFACVLTYNILTCNFVTKGPH